MIRFRASSPRPMRNTKSACRRPTPWTSMTSLHARFDCSKTIRRSPSTTTGASVTSWSMSIKTRTTRSTFWCANLWALGTTEWNLDSSRLSATRINRSMHSAVRRFAILKNLSEIFRVHGPFCLSKTIVRPRTFCPQPMLSLPEMRGAAQRICGRHRGMAR